MMRISRGVCPLICLALKLHVRICPYHKDMGRFAETSTSKERAGNPGSWLNGQVRAHRRRLGRFLYGSIPFVVLSTAILPSHFPPSYFSLFFTLHTKNTTYRTKKHSHTSKNTSTHQTQHPHLPKPKKKSAMEVEGFEPAARRSLVGVLPTIIACEAIALPLSYTPERANRRPELD